MHEYLSGGREEWGTFKLQFSEGFRITLGQKEHTRCFWNFYNCAFLVPNKESAAESGLFWANFKKLKQR